MVSGITFGWRLRSAGHAVLDPLKSLSSIPSKMAEVGRRVLSGIRIEIPSLSKMYQAYLQRKEDTNLVSVFNRLSQRIHNLPILNGDVTQNAKTVREWMAANPASLDQITELDFSDLTLTTLPPEICLFHNLQILRLRGNPITLLPEDFNDLQNLVELDLSNTKISWLPGDFDLPLLKQLDLSNTRLAYLPHAFNLPNLEVLNLSNSQSFRRLPDRFNPPNLQVLDLSNNQYLYELPDDFKPQNLRKLNLSNTAIFLLPPGFNRVNLPQLETLDLRDTSIAGMQAINWNRRNLQVLDNLQVPNLIGLQIADLRRIARIHYELFRGSDDPLKDELQSWLQEFQQALSG